LVIDSYFVVVLLALDFLSYYWITKKSNGETISENRHCQFISRFISWVARQSLTTFILLMKAEQLFESSELDPAIRRLIALERASEFVHIESFKFHVNIVNSLPCIKAFFIF